MVRIRRWGKKKIEEQVTENTFKRVEFWLEQFYQFNQQEARIIYLIGNKVDDVKNRVIKETDAKNFAKNHDLKYFETSAKTGQNINRVFENLIIDLISIYPKRTIERKGTQIKKEKLAKKEKDKKGCCK